jgi:hypothetical protein
MADEFDIPGRWSDTTITWVFRVRVGFIPPPVLRRFADSPTPHQNLVRAEAAAELADDEAVHVHGIALQRCCRGVSIHA